MVEGETAQDPKIEALITRMLLMIMAQPSLLSSLVRYALRQEPDGDTCIQFEFYKLPKEIFPQLNRLLSLDYFKKSRLVSYVRDGQSRTGLEITVGKDDLPGPAEEWAF